MNKLLTFILSASALLFCTLSVHAYTPPPTPGVGTVSGGFGNQNGGAKADDKEQKDAQDKKDAGEDSGSDEGDGGDY